MVLYGRAGGVMRISGDRESHMTDGGGAMSERRWTAGALCIAALLLAAAAAAVARIDPYFHYHAPIPAFYYVLDNERSQNDGIARHFTYDAVLTGTSMAQNFRTSQVDALFGTHCIKLPYAGATYKELDQGLRAAFSSGQPIRHVFRCLDYTSFIYDKDWMRDDLGTFPTYLYDRDPFNDVSYLLNKDVLLGRCLPMVKARFSGVAGGVTSFDDYSNWMAGKQFGAAAVLAGRESFAEPGAVTPLSEEARQTVTGNIEQNVMATVRAHPETQFWIFFPPYSAAWWGSLYEQGAVGRQIDAEEIVVDMLLSAENVRLFSFNCETQITTDLNNYNDAMHYGQAVSDLMIQCLQAGYGEITWENRDAYFAAERAFYESFDYNSLIP